MCASSVEGMLARGDQRLPGGGQLAIEHLDREDLRIRRLLADRRGDRRAVAEPIDVIVVRAPCSSMPMPPATPPTWG